MESGRLGVESAHHFPLFISENDTITHLPYPCLPSSVAARSGDRAAFGLVPHPAPHGAESCRRGLPGFLPPSAFGRHGGLIEFVAEVRGHELTTRGELFKEEAEHPRANEEYFKIQIGGLERLKEPVTAEKWKRITFLYTTGEYLLKAKTLNDLVVDGDERHVLWRSLRERAENEQLYKTDLPDLDIPPEVLMGLLGIKELEGGYDGN